MKRVLTFGVVGLEDPDAGAWLELVVSHPRCRLGPVWDPDPERLARVAEKFGAEAAPSRPVGGRPVAGVDYVLHHPVAEAVIISSAPGDRRRWVERVAQARKHWLVLGPFTPFIQTFEVTCARTREAGRAGLLAMPLLFEPALVRAAELVRAGQVGRVLSVFGAYRVRQSAELPWDPAVFPGLELLTYVISTFGRPRRLYAEDHSGRLVSVLARLPGEGILTLEFGRVLPPGIAVSAEAVFEVIGETGAFRADGLHRTVALFGDGIEQFNADPKAAVLEEFLRLVGARDPAERLRPLETVLTAYRVVEAIRRSLETGQAVEIGW